MQRAILAFAVSLLVTAAPALAQEQGGAGIAPDNFLYGIDLLFDKFAFALADGEMKAELALDMADERLAEAGLMRDFENPEAAAIALGYFTENLKLVQEQVSPPLAERAKELSGRGVEVAESIREVLPSPEAAERVFAEAEKTRLSAEVAKTAAEYCGGLAKQSLEAVQADPYCSGIKASEGVRRFVEAESKAVAREAEQAVVGVVHSCVSIGECDCGAITVKEYRERCTEAKEQALKCAYAADFEACAGLERKRVEPKNPTQLVVAPATVSLKEVMERAAQEAFERSRPAECSGTKTTQECAVLLQQRGLTWVPSREGPNIADVNAFNELLKSTSDASLSAEDVEKKREMLEGMRNYMETIPESFSEPVPTTIPAPADIVSTEGLRNRNPDFPFGSLVDWEAAGKPALPGAPPQSPPEGFASWSDYENFARSLAQKSIDIPPPKGFLSWQDWQAAGAPAQPDVPPEVYTMAHNNPVQNQPAAPSAPPTAVPICLQVITEAYNPVTLVCSTFTDSCIPEGWVTGCPSDKAVIQPVEPAPPAGFSNWHEWYNSGAPAVAGVSEEQLTAAREAQSGGAVAEAVETPAAATTTTTLFSPVPTTVPPVVPSTIPEAPSGFSSWQEWYNSGAPAGAGIPQEWVEAAHSAQQTQPLLPSVTTTTTTTIIIPTTIPAPQSYSQPAQPAPPAGFESWEAWYNSGAPAVEGVPPEMLAAAQQARASSATGAFTLRFHGTQSLLNSIASLLHRLL